MSNLAIIPARGGSKRILRKNVKDFLGKPIIAYTIEAAITSKLFDEVMVSTDDEEIAAVGKQWGASVPFMRSKENSDDFATTASVLQEVLERYKDRGRVFANACCLYATAPFITSKRVREGYESLRSGNFDSVFPVVRFSYPIWRALQVTDNNRISLIWKENMAKRSQDLPAAFHDAGQWYWFNTKAFLEKGKLWTDNSFGFEIGELEVQDIDTETDWKLAELKYQLLRAGGPL